MYFKYDYWNILLFACVQLMTINDYSYFSLFICVQLGAININPRVRLIVKLITFTFTISFIVQKLKHEKIVELNQSTQAFFSFNICWKGLYMFPRHIWIFKNTSAISLPLSIPLLLYPTSFLWNFPGYPYK